MYGKDRDDEDGAGETTFHSTDGEFKSHSCTDRRAGYYCAAQATVNTPRG